MTRFHPVRGSARRAWIRGKAEVLSDAMMLASEDGLRLYTQEHFRAALVILKTFQDVFPQSLLWLPPGPHTREAFLLGSRDEARIDWEARRRRAGFHLRAPARGPRWSAGPGVPARPRPADTRGGPIGFPVKRA